uniref:(northern house mosquito) hypothetical protein n=1 Tax=Culex pipiens TaxID=7175 RepID=A0A8D8GI95_CULPI
MASAINTVRSPLLKPIQQATARTTEYEWKWAKTIRPNAMFSTPNRKNVRFSQPIFPAMNGMKKRQKMSIAPSKLMVMAICSLVSPKSPSTNGVSTEKLSSAKLASVTPTIMLS